MSAAIIGFILGLFIGGFFGTLCLALMVASSRDHENEEGDKYGKR